MTSINKSEFDKAAQNYLTRLNKTFTPEVIEKVEQFCTYLHDAWVDRRKVFLCGNGGSAANALHIANDLHYGIGACGPAPIIPGIRVEALSANTGIITCLANDIGYENIYANQLRSNASPDDILVALSGSGNSPNIINAIKAAGDLGMKSVAILAFDGGQCLGLADLAIHFPIIDMQIAEDTQLIVGHLCMQWLNSHKPSHLMRQKNG